MNKTTLNSQKEKHSMLSLRRATRPGQRLQSVTGFLSTLSLRRATQQLAHLREVGTYFYPRSPCGERRGWLCLLRYRLRISIHALLAESDRGWCFISAFPQTFLSTLSLRRATVGLPGLHAVHADISIHALLAESDRSIPWRALRGVYFYPRSPCGERLRLLTLMLLPCIFLSTLSLRRATLAARDGLTNAIFLSTLSLRRATGYPGGKACAGLFLSTLSLRRAT